MVANYRCFTITAKANENVVDKIYKLLKEEGYVNEPFELQFVGFYEAAGTRLKINGNPLKVPDNGYFITPYTTERYLRIKKLTFDRGCSNLDIWCIY
jgi:hypothetical protein